MIRDRLLIGTAGLLLLPVSACGGGTSHGPTPTPTAASTAAPPPPPVTGEQLRTALLPRTKFRGRRRFGPSSGSLTDLLGTRLAAGVGMPNPAGTCGELARTMEIDSTKAGASALDRSYAEITYVRGPGLTADLVFETITALPADVPAAATGIKVPAGCGHYTTRWRGMRTSVTVRPLAGSGLPHISGATVSGFTAKLDVAGQGRTQIRTLSIRSGSLLILVSVGGQGDLTARTAKTAADASAYAHRRLGSG